MDDRWMDGLLPNLTTKNALHYDLGTCEVKMWTGKNIIWNSFV